ncbi:3-hydroxyacyl-CoA dehydrogenase family protein [Actinocatenispora rupis]
MGAGIAYVAAGAGYAVELVEVDPARAGAAVETLRARWDKAVGQGRTTADDAAAALGRLRTVGSLGEVAAAPAVVVEAVPERLELKRSVLREAESLRPGLLASNTSSISIGALGAVLTAPDRFCGLHFFNPVWAMALLEIVLGPDTSESTRATALDLAVRLGKDPVVVNDAPGFASSRLGVTLGLEAIRMVEDGVAAPADIDKAMTLGYRHPMGPLELTDVVGLDVRLAVAETLREAYGDRFAPPDLLVRMVAEGRLGRKTGQGFYRWVDGRRADA